MAFATADDVGVELGRPASSIEETLQWEAWLERVERTIVRGFVRAGLVLSDQVALNDPTVQDVADVEVAVVIRKVLNPAGVTSVTRSVDDASVTTRREGSDDYSDLCLTPVEWDSLISGTGGEAFSTRPGFDADTRVLKPSDFPDPYPATRWDAASWM